MCGLSWTCTHDVHKQRLIKQERRIRQPAKWWWSIAAYPLVGNGRPASILKARFAKSKQRHIKISRLAKIVRKARKLFTGSAFSAATWGHQAAALSEAQLLDVERAALASTGITKEGRCRTIALLVAFGLLGPPRARIIRETLRASCTSDVQLFHSIKLAGDEARKQASLSTNPS